MDELRIGSGPTEAAFLPDLGMLGISFRHHGDEVLDLSGGLDRYRQGHVTGLPLLAPWANRLGRWQYEIAGVAVDLRGLPLHDDGKGLPIHGTMTAQPGWEVVDRQASSATVRFDYGAHPDLLRAFPFPHELVLDVDVADGRLRVATTVRATGDRPVPVSFGWHPYLRLPAGRSATSVRLPPDCDQLQLDGRGLPTGASEPQPDAVLPLAGRSYDDAFALGEDRVLVLEGGGRAVAMQFDEGYPYAQVFSPADAAFACLEPMTAPTNALATGACRLVEPGDSFTARFSMVVGARG